jgi:hypothetical protein
MYSATRGDNLPGAHLGRKAACSSVGATSSNRLRLTYPAPARTEAEREAFELQRWSITMQTRARRPHHDRSTAVRAASAAAGLAAVIACTGPTAPATASIAGDWTLPTYALTLHQTGPTVSGLAVCTTTAGCGAATDGVIVRGEVNGGRIHLSLDTPGAPTAFTGTVDSPTTIPGTLVDGSVATPDTLRRMNADSAATTDAAP